MTTKLDKLPAGRSAVVVRLGGGRGMTQRLDAMGLRPGKVVQMLSSQLMSGPVTVLMDGREVAIGHGIARRILVETKD